MATNTNSALPSSPLERNKTTPPFCEFMWAEVDIEAIIRKPTEGYRKNRPSFIKARHSGSSEPGNSAHGSHSPAPRVIHP